MSVGLNVSVDYATDRWGWARWALGLAMTRRFRLLLLTLFPLMALLMLWIDFDTAPERPRWWRVVLVAVLVGGFLWAGRSFCVWLQRIGVRRIEAHREGREVESGSKRKWAGYVAAGAGAVAGPAFVNSVPVDVWLLLSLVAVFTFMSGWGLAPDLHKHVRHDVPNG